MAEQEKAEQQSSNFTVQVPANLPDATRASIREALTSALSAELAKESQEHGPIVMHESYHGSKD
jgi:hypothetical protein